MPHRPKRIAPRLANGLVRDNWGGRLPPNIKAALRVIARDENKSLSWVLEEVVIDFFKLPTPRYLKRKSES